MNNLITRDRQSVWHPFTQMQTYPDAIPIVKGEGAYLMDQEGKRYLDAISSWWTNLHGHAHPYIAAAISKQAQELEHVIFAQFTHPPAIELAERLLDKLPGMDKVFYSDNGSTAVEVALKMAIQYWHNIGEERHSVIAFRGAYHGDTFGAMAVGERGAFNAPFHPFLFHVNFIDPPVPGKEEDALAQMEAILQKEKPAAFIFEPLVQGSAGMVMHQAKHLKPLIERAREAGVLIIADEVMTGFGRTGKWFAMEHVGLPPDLVSLSKGLTGGTMALGVTVCTKPIFDAFLSDDPLKTFFHGHSFTANPLACAVSLASMDLLESNDCQEQIRMIGAAHQEFRQEIASHPLVQQVRQQGTIIALEVKTGKSTSYFNNIRDVLYGQFLEHGILLRPLGNVVYILPPYCITAEELKRVYQTIRTVLDSLAES